METEKNNTGRVILVLVVLIAGIYWVTNMKPKMPSSPPTQEDDSIVEEESVEKVSMCFEFNSEAGDRAELKLDTLGSEVSGEFNWLPFEKDSKTGTFKGNSSPLNVVKNVMWEASGEGITNTEELKLRYVENGVSPGFGEMKDSGDGVYVYADPENISYDLVLSKVECE